MGHGDSQWLCHTCPFCVLEPPPPLSRDPSPWQGILQGVAEPRGIGAFLFINVFHVFHVFYFEMTGKSASVQQWRGLPKEMLMFLSHLRVREHFVLKGFK